MKYIYTLTLILVLLSCGSPSENGLNDETKLENMRLFNEKFELMIPTGMLRLNSTELTEYDVKNPPQAGFYSSDKSVIITIRNLPVNEGEEEIRFNTIVEVLETITSNAGANKTRNEVSNKYNHLMFIMDMEGKFNDKLIFSTAETIGSFAFLVVDKGEYFFFEMHYPARDIQQSVELKEKILSSFRILKERFA